MHAVLESRCKTNVMSHRHAVFPKAHSSLFSVPAKEIKFNFELKRELHELILKSAIHNQLTFLLYFALISQHLMVCSTYSVYLLGIHLHFSIFVQLSYTPGKEAKIS